MADNNFKYSLIVVILVFMSILSAVVFLLGFISLPVIFVERSYKEQYAIVVDAGSTGSRIYLYSWRLPFYGETGVAYEHSDCKVEGGIGTYTNATAAGESLVGCVENVLQYVPADLNSPPDQEVKVWVAATAGMRVLKKVNESLSNDILKSVETSLNNINTDAEAEILPGQEEALGAWISSNYINGTLNKQYPLKRDATPETRGAMDLGGASMQISYLAPGSSDSNTVTTELFGTSYNVYARSYLCYGVREAFRRIQAYGAMEANYSSVVQNPCVHKGHVLNWSASFLFSGYCREEFSKKGGLPDGMNITINGSGDYSQCQHLVQRAMNFSVNVSNGQPIEYQQPRPVGNFFGLSSFYYTSNFFGLTTLNGSSLNYLPIKVAEYCSLEWSDVLKQYGQVDKEEYLTTYCSDGTYLSYILTDGLGFRADVNDWSINSVRKINGLSVGWSLGYMLQLTKEFVDSEYHTRHPFSVADLVIGMLVMILLSISSIIVMVIICHRGLKYTKKANYSDLS